jgi:hypothetical protein
VRPPCDRRGGRARLGMRWAMLRQQLGAHAASEDDVGWLSTRWSTRDACSQTMTLSIVTLSAEGPRHTTVVANYACRSGQWRQRVGGCDWPARLRKARMAKWWKGGPTMRRGWRCRDARRGIHAAVTRQYSTEGLGSSDHLAMPTRSTNQITLKLE